MNLPTDRTLSRTLESLYEKFNERSFADRDPVRFLHDYTDPRDIEAAGLIASSLAYGRVGGIIKTVSCVLDDIKNAAIGSSGLGLSGPAQGTPHAFNRCFEGFRYRFTDGAELASLLAAIRSVTREYGSLAECFFAHRSRRDTTVLPALTGFVTSLLAHAPSGVPSLIPDPSKGSACKRLNLFLRWMVRKDNIDPGPWKQIDPSLLIVPLDTHMHRVGLRFGFTKRSQSDIRTAIEITEGFRKLKPDDPVRYDFALTHASIEGRSL